MNSDIQAYRTTLKALVGDDDPMAILALTPSLIKAAIRDVPATALDHPPSPGKWSMTEIVAHLADSELVFGYRLRTIVTIDGANLQAFDPDRWAATFDYRSCDAHTSAALFGALRMGTLRMLRSVAGALMENTGRHEEWGTETARSLIRLEAGHDKSHLAQIYRILESAGDRTAFTPAPQKPEIKMEVASQLDLRVGTIVDMEEVPGANRLMKLIVDFGTDRRTVIAGVREERRDARVLIGRQALFYYNVPRKKIRGHLSEAMLCDVGYADGVVPALLEPEWPVPNGTRAG